MKRSLAARFARGRIPMTVAVAVALVLAGSAVALAYWSAGSAAAAGYAYAGRLPRGSTPRAAVTGSTVRVTWQASRVPPGVPVPGYRVSRFDAAGREHSIQGGCTAPVAATRCAEQEVPDGVWSYVVQPLFGSRWVGEPGEPSEAVTVTAGAARAQRSASTGPTASAPATPPAPPDPDGTAQPSGAPSAPASAPSAPDRTDSPGGPGSPGTPGPTTTTEPGTEPGTDPGSGDDAAFVAVDIQATGRPGGVTGRVEAGDGLVFSYRRAVDPASVVPGWRGERARAVTVVLRPATGGDRIRCYDAATGRPLSALGVVELARHGYATAPVSFAARLAVAGKDLVLTLGPPGHERALGTVDRAGTIRWRPGGGTDRRGVPLAEPGRPVAESSTSGPDVDF